MLAACGVLLGGIGFAQAQIIADKSAPANQQAAVLKHSSGAPLVNIQTPTAKGLSHNRYTQFDVDNKGAVLNNSRTANPNLAKGSAKVILNETNPKIISTSTQDNCWHRLFAILQGRLF